MHVPFYSSIFREKGQPNLVKQSVKRYFSKSTVAQNLPAEVIYQIFAPFSTTLQTNNLTAFPWFLGHICSTWRSMFHSMTTEFWSTILISFDQDSDDDCCDFRSTRPLKNRRHMKRVVQFFLDRDPTAPLSFALVVSQPPYDQDQDNIDQIDQIVKVLIDQSMRWKEVSFQCRYLNLTQFGRARDHLPLLQKLRLMTTNVDNARLSPVFGTAPSLNVIKCGMLGKWKFVWSNLKDITLDYTDSTFYHALPHMTNLERLYVRHEGIRFKHPSVIISLPRLTSLHCDPTLLQAIEAPVLEDFAIGCSYYFHPPPVLSFLRRSSCNILRLKIRSAKVDTVMTIIKDTPQITRLILVDIPHVERALEQLAISAISDREPLARHMQSLHVQDYYVKDIFATEANMRILSRLIASRAGAAGDHTSCERLQRLGTYWVAAATAEKLIALCKECQVDGVEEYEY